MKVKQEGVKQARGDKDHVDRVAAQKAFDAFVPMFMPELYYEYTNIICHLQACHAKQSEFGIYFNKHAYMQK